MTDNDTKGAAGCIMSVATLLIHLPLWYALVGGMLAHIGAPTWMWVIFWVYVPVGVVLGVMRSCVELLGDK